MIMRNIRDDRKRSSNYHGVLGIYTEVKYKLIEM